MTGHLAERVSVGTVPAEAGEAAGLASAVTAIAANVESVIDGKRDAVRTALTVLLAGGHLLVEDVPGVGKTMLAKAIARSVDGSVSRLQFTPDLLPSDVTGVAVFDQASGRFDFKPGPVFANIVIGDEINRASPKTQAALLECMEERQVTVDGGTHPLPEPFTVFATQNPVEMEGTYALPEAQRDRFTARIAMGYPDRDAELEMLDARDASSPLETLRPVIDVETLRGMIARVRRVFASAPIKQYAVDIARATRDDPDLRLGASPRATLQLVRAAKAAAAMDGRDFVIPDDVDGLVVPVLAHRLVPGNRVIAGTHDTATVVREILERIHGSVAVPIGAGPASDGR